MPATETPSETHDERLKRHLAQIDDRFPALPKKDPGHAEREAIRESKKRLARQRYEDATGKTPAADEPAEAAE